MAKGDPTSAKNLKTDQLPRVRSERAEPGSAQLSAEGLSTLSQWRREPQRRLENGAQKFSKNDHPRPARAGRAEKSAATSRGSPHTQSVAMGFFNVGLGAALQDAEKWNQSAYQTHHAQEPVEGDSARSAAAPEAQRRLKNCAESTT